MIRLGIVDFDTSHAVEFTKRLNHVGIAEDQWVEGARVVAGVPGRSQISPEVIPQNLETLKGFGVEILDDPAELFGKVDAVMIEAVDGSVHLERAMPFLEKGMPTYVDKPFACSMADAKAMVKIAMEKHIPLMSSSSLRYAPEVVAARGGTGPVGEIIGVSTYGPAPTHPRNPGLFHYGIHPVEMLFTLMGPGCQKVTNLSTPGAEVVTGLWSDGRIASIRGIRDGKADYGFTLFGTKGVQTQGVSTQYIYRELLKKIVGMFETRQLPIDLRETLEIVAFIEAARKSAEAQGATVELPA
ncbi:Gfo/Idh/MocA family protein [Tundrisphaera lichenicola]|uniref:Gfo/Idh/MocA family protein n=1 Tax=Tundrisphaera lichenicola TaxID=2029860 RepID=UPI003EBE7A56